MTFRPETMHRNWIRPLGDSLAVVVLTYAALMQRSPVDDTAPEVRRRQLDRLRAMTPEERAAMADALSSAVIDLSIADAMALSPSASAQELLHEVRRRRFGRAIVGAASPPGR